MKRVQFIETRERLQSFVVKDRYEFKPKGRFQFLQRWAWSFLRWAGALQNASDLKVTYTRHIIDPADVLERLYKQRASLFDYGQTPKELLIGSEDFAELMNAPAMRSAASFQAEYYHGDKIMGLTVRVIPWMSGMVVMPETWGRG